MSEFLSNNSIKEEDIKEKEEEEEESRDIIISSLNSISSLLLDNISILMAPITVSSGLLIKGNININKLIISLQHMITYCPWIACSLHVDKNNGNTFVKPRKNNNNNNNI